MKFPCRIVVALAAMVLCCAAIGSAEWRIDIESKTVSPGQTDVTVDFTIYTDLDVSQVTVPIIVQEIDPGAFWTGQLPYDTAYLGSGGEIHGMEWKWEDPAWPTLIQMMRPAFLAGENDWCCPAVDPCVDLDYDGVSPDQFAFISQGVFDLEPEHPNGHVFATITFDVTSTPGDFEFDTACFVLGQKTIYLVGEDYIDHGPSGPSGDFDGFNKGIITIQADNEAPVWDPIAPKEVDEGANLNFAVSASDADGDPLTLTVEDEPATVDFTDNGDGTGTFDWTPGDTESGIYEVRFIASDGTLADTEMVEITVNDVNAVLETGEGMPTEYALGQNFPNPFNASTKIDFALRQAGHAKLVVFNILGQRISTLVDEYLPAGPQSASWNGTDATGNVVPSGMYFYRLTAGDFSELKKMVLMK